MIKPGEIQQKARDTKVRDQQIEKDYILSWILFGIANHKHLSKAIVFKGGTVLKKMYFEDYRFSEDLDFTMLNDEISNGQIFEWFKESFSYVLEEANIRFEIIGLNTDQGEQEDTLQQDGLGGINFYISYVGPLGGQGSNKKVKVDISRSEKMEFKPVMKAAFLGYTDLKKHLLLCYSLEEILIEKMRSVMQRMQARDFYDIWYLLEVHRMDPNIHLKEFANKCVTKKLNPKDFPKKLAERLLQYKGRWQSSMSEQIKDLQDFDQTAREIQRYLKKLKL